MYVVALRHRTTTNINILGPKEGKNIGTQTFIMHKEQ